MALFMSRPRFILIVFFATAVMILTAWLRTSSSRIFYQYRGSTVQRELLEQQVGEKQVEVFRLTNPEVISESSDGSEESGANDDGFE